MPPDYVIDTLESIIKGPVNLANFSISGPDNGRPRGDCRFGLMINGRKLASAKFKIE